MPPKTASLLKPEFLGRGAGEQVPSECAQEWTFDTAQTLSALTRSGASYLVVRYGLSIIVSLGNMFVMTRWIGPHAYGVFVTAVGLSTFLSSLTRFGVDTYLVRSETAPGRREYGIASTLVLLISVVLFGGGAATIPLLQRWYAGDEFVAPYLVLLASIPIIGLGGVPVAKLERELNFRAVAGIELGGQCSSLVVALILAWLGWGVWAPVAGFVTWQMVALVSACIAARLLPDLSFEASEARKMLAFGFGFSASLRTWQLRNLINPLLVGRFIGAEGVAYVAFAIRMAEGLSFVRTAAGRLAIATLSRVQSDRARFGAVLEQALQWQVIALGPLLCAFAVSGGWIVPRFMGPRWQPALAVYPYIAAGVLVNSVFNLQASALFVVGRQWAVMRAYASHVFLLAAGTFLLLPRWGIRGYGWAELVACTGYLFLHGSLSRVVSLSYKSVLPWMAAFLPPLLFQAVSSWQAGLIWLPLSVVLAGSGWHRLRRTRGVRLNNWWIRDSLPVPTRRWFTFIKKTRQRGLPYVMEVCKYRAASAGYRIRRVAADIGGYRDGERTAGANGSSFGSVVSLAKFHFLPAEIPAIVASIPAELKEKRVAEAEEILQQRFHFRGMGQTLASPIDWDTRPNGNLSWNWDLNRHSFFLTLATAHFYTGERIYLEKLVELWSDWLRKNPAGTSPNWRYPFEVAARLQNWMWADFLLTFAGGMEARLSERLVSGIRDHACYISTHLEHHWPNNHLLLEAKALYEFALLFPELDAGGRFLRLSKGIVEREALAQILPDGVHSELCTMYHLVVAGELAELSLLCRRLGKPLSDELEQRIFAMTDFSRALLRHDGSRALLGDSAAEDTYVRFDPARREYSDLNYWLAGECEWSELFGLANERGNGIRTFPDAGYAILASGASADEIHLTFDFGEFSACSSANHGHCDALSFELHAGGRPLIVDPGVYMPWPGNPVWTRHFRSTSAHNTLMIDGREQSELSDYCDVERTAKTALMGYEARDHELSIGGECRPYWANGEEVRHVRELCLRSDRTILVRDRVTGWGRHRLEWSFQFAPDLEAIGDESGCVTASLSPSGKSSLTLQASAGKMPALQLIRGQSHPLRGWVSRNCAQVSPAYAAVYSADVDLPYEIEFTIWLR
jgi:O-antigen/teichoic acid export membrane protein/uncharacterized heparinase superfamily protein